MSTCRIMNVDLYTSSYIKLKSKWIKDLNIKPDTINLIEEKVANNHEHIGTGDNFLNRTPMTCVLSSTIDKSEFMKLQSSVKQRTLTIVQIAQILGKDFHQSYI